MAKKTINLGTGELTGDGESIRSAFDKINDNFDETYADIVAIRAEAFSGDYNDLTNKPTIPSIGDITFAGSTISAPDDNNITIQALDEDSALRSRISLSPDVGAVSMRGYSRENSDTFNTGDWDTATWITGGGGGQVVIVNAAAINDFLNNDLGSATGVTFSINGGIAESLGSRSYSSLSQTLTLYTADAPETDPTTVTEIEFFYSFSSRIGIDYDDGSVSMSARGSMNVSINSERDINLSADDDVRIEGADSFRLINTSTTAPIQIITDDNNAGYSWNFEADGSLTFPDNTVQSTAYPGPQTSFDGAGPVSFNNDYYEDGFRGGFTTDKSILQINGAEYLNGSDDGGGIYIAGGTARNGGNNGDVIIASGVGGADDTGFISLLSSYITAAGTWIGTQTMDIKGSVFADDSTLLVDGVNAKIPYSVLDGAPSALSEFSNDLDYAGIVGTTIQNNGLPVNTFTTGTLTVNAQLTVEESFSSTPTTKFFEIETGAGNNRILRTGVNMSAFAQEFGPGIDLTSYRSSPANGDAGPELVLRASTGASVNDVIATIGTEVTDVTDGDVTTKISFTVQNDGITVAPLTVNGSTVDMQSANQVSISNENGAVDIYGGVEFNNGTTAFQAGNSVDFNCPVDFSNATVDWVNAIGVIPTPYTKFFLNTDAETKPPNPEVSNSFYLGENWGTWYEVNNANSAFVGTLAPSSADYDPTLTGISFNSDRFQGFAQGGVYELMIEIETQDSFGRTAEVEEYALETSTDAYANFTRYYPGNNQYQTLQYSGTFVFENANTAANWVRIILNSNMKPNYYIPKATFTIKRIA